MDKKRILIVEDEQQVAAALGRALQHPRGGGYQVETSPSADEALTKIQHEQFDLIITDLRMPGTSGLELIRQVRCVSPGTRTILITAFGSPEVETQTRQLAAVYLTKPFSLQDFVSIVQSALTEEKRSAQQILILDENSLETIGTMLEQLQTETGASLVLLSDLMGRVMAEVGTIEHADWGTACTLLGNSMAASSALAHTLGEEKTLGLYYHEGKNYHIYAATVYKDILLSLFFDCRTTNSRIGMVWLYLKRAVGDLHQQLSRVVTSTKQQPMDTTLAQALGDALDDALNF